MAAQGEKVGSLYVDVGADISKLNEALDAAETRLNSLSNGNYQFNISQGSTKGGGKDPIQALQKTLNQAQLTVPVSLSLANGALETLKAAILAGMAGFVVPVRVQMSGVAQGGQQIVVDGETGTVVTPARAANKRARSGGRTATAGTAAQAEQDPRIKELLDLKAKNDSELASIQKEMADAAAATAARRRTAIGRRFRDPSGRVISNEAWQRDFSERISSRMERELRRSPDRAVARRLHRAGVTAEEFAETPNAERAVSYGGRPLMFEGDPYLTMTGRALALAGREPRPTGGRAHGFYKYGSEEHIRAMQAREMGLPVPEIKPRPVSDYPLHGSSSMTEGAVVGTPDASAVAANRLNQQRREAGRGVARRIPIIGWEPRKKSETEEEFAARLAHHGFDPQMEQRLQTAMQERREQGGTPYDVIKEERARISAEYTPKQLKRHYRGSAIIPRLTQLSGIGTEAFQARGALGDAVDRAFAAYQRSQVMPEHLLEHEPTHTGRRSQRKLPGNRRDEALSYGRAENLDTQARPYTELTSEERLARITEGVTATDEQLKVKYQTHPETPAERDARLARNQAAQAEYFEKHKPMSQRQLVNRIVREAKDSGTPVTREYAKKLATVGFGFNPPREEATAATGTRGAAAAAPPEPLTERQESLIAWAQGMSRAKLKEIQDQSPDFDIKIPEILAARRQKKAIGRYEKGQQAGAAPTDIGGKRLSIEETIAYNQELSKAAEPTAGIANVAGGGRGNAGGGRRAGAMGASGGVVNVFVTNWPPGLGGVKEGGASMSGTPEDIAKQLGVSKEDLTKILTGEMAPPTGKAAKRLRYREPVGLTRYREPGESDAAVAYSSSTDPRMRQTEERVARAEARVLNQVAPRVPEPGSTGTSRSLDRLFRGIEEANRTVKPETPGQPSAQLRNLARARGFDVARPDLTAAREAAQLTNRDKAQLQRERASLPERAPSTAFAQVFARLTGTKTRFEEAVGREQAAETRLDTVRTTQAETKARIDANRANFTSVRSSLEARRAAGESYDDEVKALRTLRSEHSELAKSSGALGKEEAKASADFDASVKARQRAGGGLASAAQVGALFIGVKAFMLANQAFEAGISAIGAAIQPVVNDMFDFAETSKRVTGALRDQTVANKGNVDATIAAASAQAGLSAATSDLLKSAGLGQRVIGQAGGVAGLQTRDLFRATLGTGGGFDKSLFQGTGGLVNSQFFAEQLGGQPSAIESIAKNLGEFGQRAGTGSQYSAIPRPPGIDELLSLFGNQRNAPAETEQERTQAQKLYIAAVNNSNEALDRQSKAAGEGTKQFQLVANATEEQKNAMIASADTISAEAGLRARELAAGGAAITGARAQGLTGQEFGEATRRLTEGLTIQDPKLLVEQQRRAFNADLQASDLRRQQAQNVTIPGALALQLAAHPLLPGGTGIIPRGTDPEALRPAGSTELGPNLRELSRGIAKNNEYQAEIKKLQAAGVAALVEQIGQTDDLRKAAYTTQVPTQRRGGTGLVSGTRTVEQPGFEPNLPKFQELFTKLTAYGRELAGIQQDLADKQALNAIQDYNQAITITVRNLNDAKALAGQRARQDNLGVGALERQNVLLQRQSQELAFQLQQLQLQQEQRRINFQVAIAGFQAPGQTSEQREANIQQAKKEAEFAQKQLDIQKQQAALGRKQFKIGVEIQDRSFVRTIQELEFQLNSLERGRKLTIDTKEATDRANALEVLIAQTSAQIGTIVEQSAGISEKVISIGQEIASAAGGAVKDVVNATVRQLTRGVNQYAALARQINRIAAQQAAGAYSGGEGADAGRTVPYNARGQNAAGALFNTSGSTSMIVGEAGTETVAVLRNPRMVSASVGGSGGGSVVIQFNGPMNVRSDDDVKAVAREVERMMNSRGALIGLRNLTK